MRLLAEENIALDRDTAFSQIVDIELLEVQLLKRGAEIARTDAPGAGAAWAGEVPVFGALRAVQGQFIRWIPPEGAVLQAVSGGLTAEVAVEFTALSENSTRLAVSFEMSARGLSDRMLLNSLKLTKTHLSGRFSQLVQSYARDAERRAVNI